MKIKSQLSNQSRNTQSLLLLTLLLLVTLPLAGCSDAAEPRDTYYPSQDLSVTFETNGDQIQANLIVTNPGESEFPGDREFHGRMNLWNESGESLGWAEVEILSAIGPGESSETASLSWELDPGVYFLAWGEPDYGGVVSIFFVADMLSGSPEVVSSQSFQTKPVDYGSDISSCGMIKSFTLNEDGNLLVSGESPLPDQSCLFPLIYSWKGLVGGYPFGDCVQIADGSWQLEVPDDPGNDGFQLEEDTSYRVIVFSSDLRIPPSEPFEIQISPPVQE